MASKTIISKFESRHEFFSLLKSNPGLIVLKFGAEWCGPCKKIAHVVEGFFGSSPPEVICADIDVDESFDLYAFYKSKKLVNGIPVMLCFKKGNTGYVPDDSVTGIDPKELSAFFNRCGMYLNQTKHK